MDPVRAADSSSAALFFSPLKQRKQNDLKEIKNVHPNLEM